MGPIGLFGGAGVGSKTFLGCMYIGQQLLFSMYHSILILSCSLSLLLVVGGVVVFGDYRVLPNFLFCGVGVVVEVGVELWQQAVMSWAK